MPTMQLIDADALLKKLAPLVDAAKEDRELMALLTAMTMVRKMPTIEVEKDENKVTHWMPFPDEPKED